MYEVPTIVEDASGRSWKETIKRGAARKTVGSGRNIRALYGHEKNKILARTDKGTLALKEDEFGVEVDLKIPKSTLGSDTVSDIENGNIDGFSAGWTKKNVKDKWYKDSEGNLCRDIYELDLSEVSLTSIPNYPGTHAEVRDTSPPEEVPTYEDADMKARLIIFLSEHE